MRVIAGEKRGLVLVSPEGKDVRPTHDRVREAVFGKLQFFIPGRVFLDLFAGSGAMGIEALSRGAEKAIFVDNSRASVKIINENIAKSGFALKSKVWFCDWMSALSNVPEKSVGVIYVDPPYASGVYGSVLQQIEISNVLEDDGYIILESDGLLESENCFFETEKSKRYGKAFITYLRKKNEKSMSDSRII